MRRVILLGVALVVVVALIGCGESAEESTTEPSASPTAVNEEVSEKAEIKIEGSGFSVGEDEKAGYGIVLHNASDTEDAHQVAVTVNLLDESGKVLATDNHSLTLVPAGETFHTGGLISDAKKAAKLEASVEVGSSEPAKYDLPQTMNVVAVKNTYSSGTRVEGEVKNTLEDMLSKSARLGCVLFDENNEVVGGGFTYLRDDLASGQTAAFLMISGPLATPYSAVAQVEASIENEPSTE